MASLKKEQETTRIPNIKDINEKYAKLKAEKQAKNPLFFQEIFNFDIKQAKEYGQGNSVKEIPFSFMTDGKKIGNQTITFDEWIIGSPVFTQKEDKKEVKLQPEQDKPKAQLRIKKYKCKVSVDPKDKITVIEKPDASKISDFVEFEQNLDECVKAYLKYQIDSGAISSDIESSDPEKVILNVATTTFKPLAPNKYGNGATDAKLRGKPMPNPVGKAKFQMDYNDSNAFKTEFRTLNSDRKIIPFVADDGKPITMSNINQYIDWKCKATFGFKVMGLTFSAMGVAMKILITKILIEKREMETSVISDDSLLGDRPIEKGDEEDEKCISDDAFAKALGK